jgi:hypothetical protein
MKQSCVFLLAASLLFLGFGHAWSSTGITVPARVLGRDARAARTARSTPVLGDELWGNDFALPVTDGSVNTAIEYQGSIVIAGRFSRVGTVPANNIAQWDGTNWIPLGKGIEWGYINSLAIHQGDLVVAGKFSFAGGILARSIARWNGSQWSAFGGGFHDANTNPREVLCVASRQDTLIAAVDLSYEHYYGDPFPVPFAALIDYWNGNQWVDLGPGSNGPVRSLAFHDGALFAGGAFDSLGSGPAAGIARWDGTSWSEVGGGLGTGGRSVEALIEYSGKLIAGGGFDSAGGISVSNIAAWDGIEWSTLGTPPAQVGSLAVQGDTLVAGCMNAVARWDGQTWVPAATGLVGTPTGLVPQGEDLFLAGTIEATNPGEDTPTALSVVRLSDGTWHSLLTVSEGMQGLTGSGGESAVVNSMTTYRNRVIAAGSFRFAGAPPGWTRLAGLAEWTGTHWAPFPLPPGLDTVCFLLVKADTLYLAGTLQGSPVTPSPVFKYDGTQWTPLGNQPSSFVWAMTLVSGDLYAVMYEPPYTIPSVRRWTGSTWETIGVPSGPDIPFIATLAEYQGNLVAAGRFSSIDGAPAANIAVWDKTHWQEFGLGLPSPSNFPEAILRFVAASDGHLVAAGDHIPGVVRWSGSAWEQVGELHGPVYALQEAGGQLFASGYFTTPDFTRTYYLTRWHEDTWQELGSGTNDLAVAFAALGSSVYMGGLFSEAGAKPSYAIARWDELATLPVLPALQAGRPNPFGVSTTFSYALPRQGDVRLSIHDVSGREVAVIEEGSRSAGIHTVTWYGRDRSGRAVPSGVYFLRAILPGGSRETKKIVLLR